MAKVSVRFFRAVLPSWPAATGRAVNVSTPATVGDVIARVREVFPGTQAMPPRPLAALNRRQVKARRARERWRRSGTPPPLSGG